MLANGADNSAVHNFQTLRTFLVNFKTFGKLTVYLDLFLHLKIYRK